MPTVTIDDRTVEVPAGTNLVDAAQKVGVQIPHYCYHPRLSVVGQCRMCMVEIQGMPKLQAACSTQVMKDGMIVRTQSAPALEAQRAIMEFLLINHPLDCPICDQAGECGLQDYSFKHGQAYSRFRFEEKRTYPEKERIPLGPTVILNMNRCIQCTRCIRFTHEISKTGELSFFERGSHAEIGTFPGRPLDNPLSTCVVDICPVGALTSTRFRFAERVWYLDKNPSICTGCDAGCNITLEHRRGAIRRLKPRFNPEVNDYWMCDHGRATHERYHELPRLAAPMLRRDGERRPVGWREALDTLFSALRAKRTDGGVAILGSGFLTTEESWLLARLSNLVDTPHRSAHVDPGPERHIPNPAGGVFGRDAAPNRRGAELAGLVARDGGLDAGRLVEGDGASHCSALFVADSDFGPAAHDPAVVERLRQARFLVVMGWADTPLAKVADLVLPSTTTAETTGTFVNSTGRLQRFERAFAPPTQSRSGVEILADLLARFDAKWSPVTPAVAFDLMCEEIPALAGLRWAEIPPTGVLLEARESEAMA
ncbi:MAG: molybdopterin-dependent oxidoreductase [Thermoanaerobaculia bacterium]|nr:MAG: molybdopterin-dependent oxidoreductase [Thermoanaerobaculia bacterium]MBZ0103161.1 (2Fe-2S)-binding protein [Thermoanaerobaculia bacterium]